MRLIFVVLSATTFLATAALADQSITVGGVRGGAVYALTRSPSNPSHVVAGTVGAGLFTSSNGGATWSVSPLPEITSHSVSGVGIAADSSEVVCGDPGGAGLSPMLFSSNGGASWAREPFADAYANCVTLVGGKTTGTWFAGVITGAANNPNPSSYGGKLYRSTDRGKSWTATALALTGQAPSAILETPSGRILVGTRQTQGGGSLGGTAGGLQYSDDGGGTWNTVGSIQAATVALAQNTAGTLVGVFYDTTNHALIETSTDGANWTVGATISPVGSGLDSQEGEAIFDRGSDTFLVLTGEQVFRSGTGPAYSFASSTDLSATATSTNLSIFHHSRIDADPTNPNRILLADRGGDGLFVTTNGGASWGLSNEGFNAQSIDLAIKHPPSGYRYATNGLGYVYFSAGDFSSFKKIFRGTGDQGNTAEFPNIYGIAFDRNDPGRVLISNERQSDFTPHLRLLSDAVSAPEDAAPYSHSAWIDITPPGSSNTTILAMLVDGSNLTVGLAPLNNGASGQYLYRSADAGGSWTPLNLTTTGGIRALAWGASASEIYAGASDGGNGQQGPPPSSGNGLFKSTDGGTTWIPLSSNTELNAEAVYKIAVDPGNPQRLWVLSTIPGGGGGASPTHVYESLDGGTTITAITPSNFGPNGDQNNDATAFDLAYIAVEDKVIIATGGAVNGYMYAPGSGDRHWKPAFATYGNARALYSGSVGAGGGGGLFEITNLGLPDNTGGGGTDGGGKHKGCGCDLEGGGIGLGALLAAFPILRLLRRRKGGA